MDRYELIDQLVGKKFIIKVNWRVTSGGGGGRAGVLLIKNAVSILLETCSFTMMCHQLVLQH